MLHRVNDEIEELQRKVESLEELAIHALRALASGASDGAPYPVLTLSQITAAIQMGDLSREELWEINLLILRLLRRFEP